MNKCTKCKKKKADATTGSNWCTECTSKAVVGTKKTGS